MSTFRTGLEDLVKRASEDQKKDEGEDESHLGRNLAMGAAAASPFAGLIGQQPILHDPLLNRDIPRVKNLKELSRLAQPGDVLLTTKPSGSLWKSFIKPTSGSEFYHAQPVVHSRQGKGTTLSAGEYADAPYNKMTERGVKRTMESIADIGYAYPDVMVMRPKKPLTPDEVKRFTQETIQRGQQPYDKTKAVGTWLKELFIPKIKGLEKTTMPPICEGNVCSTLPAMAHANIGRTVVPGKAPQDVFPADYLRSTEFEPVAVRLRNEYAASPMLRKAMPYLTRAGVGLGLAGATYGLSQNPALAAIPLGLAGGGMAANALSQHLGGKAAPNVFEFLNELPDTQGRARRALLRGFAGKTLPGMLLGGGLAYAGARGLQHLLSSGARSSSDSPDGAQPA